MPSPTQKYRELHCSSRETMVIDSVGWDEKTYLKIPWYGWRLSTQNEREEPKRMFAGEGGPARTNERFHFFCKGEKVHRLSTAFDW